MSVSLIPLLYSIFWSSLYASKLTHCSWNDLNLNHMAWAPSQSNKPNKCWPWCQRRLPKQTKAGLNKQTQATKPNKCWPGHQPRLLNQIKAGVWLQTWCIKDYSYLWPGLQNQVLSAHSILWILRYKTQPVCMLYVH